jgi:hypothetical protein
MCTQLPLLLLTCAHNPAQIMRFDVLDSDEVDNRFTDGSDLVQVVLRQQQAQPVRTRRVGGLRLAGCCAVQWHACSICAASKPLHATGTGHAYAVQSLY